MRVTNEQRDNMVFAALTLGQTTKTIAEEVGCSELTVKMTVRVFDLVRREAWDELRGLYVRNAKLGVNILEWAQARLRVNIPKELVRECTDAQLSLGAKYRAAAEKTEPAKPEPVKAEPKAAAPEAAPAGPKMHIPAVSAEIGWQTRIKVSPDRVCMAVYFNGVQVVEGWSRVKGNKELDLMQAISYAAHMCYKITEQKKLGCR